MAKSYAAANCWWAEEDPNEAAKQAYAAATQLESEQEYRKKRAWLSVALYQSRGANPGVPIGDPLVATLGDAGDMLGDSDVNAGLLRSAADTLKAEIAGRVKPTVQFLTRGADWKTKRKAEGLSDWTDAIFRSPQGNYQNLWCLAPELFLDALIFGEGWAEVSSECVDEKHTYDITFSRQFPWEMFFDENEARYGRPRNLFRVTSMPESEALRRFVDEADGSDEEKHARKQAILGAEDADDFGQQVRIERMIKVAEAWRVKRGHDEGRHIIALSSICLYDEEWDREDFPFARMCWEKERLGHRSRSMVEQGESLHLEFNENLQRLSTRLNLLGNLKTFVEDGSLMNETDMLGNEEGQIVMVRPGAQFPVQAKPDPIGASEVGYLDRILQLFYSTLGVSEMKASSRKEPGVDSGVAIRLMNDQQAGRFATPAEGYERFFVDCALCAIAEARMLSKRYGGKVKVRSEKRGEIDFKSVELPERQVDITSHPASALSTDPAQRIATAQELFGAGLISGPTFLRLIQLPDLESELNQQTIVERYSEWIVCKLLDADPKDPDSAYVAPDDLVPNKGSVMLYVANAYLEALLDGAPPENLDLIRRFIADLDDVITRIEQQKAEQMPPMPGAGAPPPGAAPMTPMPPGPPLQ
jgi:hypothetical protein